MLFSVCDVLFGNAALLIIAVLQVSNPVLIGHRNDHSKVVILIPHGAAIGVGNRGQILPIILIAHRAPRPVCDLGYLARSVEKVQILPAGQRQPLNGGAAIGDLHAVPMGVDHCCQAAALIIAICLSACVFCDFVAGAILTEHIRLCSTPAVYPAFRRPLKVLLIEIFLQHDGAVALDLQAHPYAAQPPVAQKLPLMALQRLVAAHQPELANNIWKDKICLLCGKAAGNRVNGIAFLVLIILSLPFWPFLSVGFRTIASAIAAVA